MVNLIKVERMNSIDDIELNDPYENQKFVEWKSELNKELKSFWKAMIK